jgi:hypothetical protein
VQLDGGPLPETSATATAAGWFRESADVVVIRHADDGHAHVFELR